MGNPLYDYSPITERPPMELPDGKRLGFYVGVNIEHYPYGVPSAGLHPAFAQFVPDPFNEGWRDYGVRVGIWRMIDLFDQAGVNVTALTNSDVCKYYPQIIQAGIERNWDWVAHGQNNTVFQGTMDEADEIVYLDEMLAVFDAALPARPTGWLGPGLSESPATPRLLRERGFTYVLDWCSDDRPFPVNVPGMVTVPYCLETNDIMLFLGKATTGPQYEQIIMDGFEVLLAEGGHVMALALHPMVIGQPFRSKYLARIVERIAGHPEVWVTTASEIAARYLAMSARFPSGESK